MTPSRFVILFLLSAFVWSGCSNVTFTEPMPLNRRDLPSSPPNGAERGPMART